VNKIQHALILLKVGDTAFRVRQREIMPCSHSIRIEYNLLLYFLGNSFRQLFWRVFRGESCADRYFGGDCRIFIGA
jgi:hypothetical protein